MCNYFNFLLLAEPISSDDQPVNWSTLINMLDLSKIQGDKVIKENFDEDNATIVETTTANSKYVYGTRVCERDYNCGKNMECLNNICYCIPGFFPENDYCVGN